MKSSIRNLLKTAKSQLGTLEEPKNSNNIKYNDEYYGAKGFNYAWCVVFVWWVFKHSNMSGLFMGGAKANQCTKVRAYAKASGCWVTGDYQPGDLLLFDWNGDGSPQHIGICIEEPNGNTVKTIEGNTSPAGKPDGVYEMTRKLSTVCGAYRPGYPDDVEQPSSWAKDECEWAVKNKIIRGRGNGVYGWKEPITREEMAVLLRRLYELDKK